MSQSTAKRSPRATSKHHRAPNTTLRVLGALVTRKRHELGLSSRALAKELGLSQSGLSRIENGDREMRLEILRKLVSVLNLWAELERYLKTGKWV